MEKILRKQINKPKFASQFFKIFGCYMDHIAMSFDVLNNNLSLSAVALNNKPRYYSVQFDFPFLPEIFKSFFELAFLRDLSLVLD